MNKIPFTKSFVANTVTSLNIFCGFLSLIYTSHGDFKMGAIFIIVAAIFDTMDGIVARLLGTSSRFGVELDSLSDVVSFGAAPAFLVYKAYAFQFGVWGIIISSLILIFGALRLARFNINVEDLNSKGDFTGLPIPMAAITISLLIFSFYRNGTIIEPYNYIVIPLVILLAGLMVSKIRYNALPKIRDRKFKQKVLLFVTLIIALVLAVITNGQIVFYIFISLILFGIIRQIYNLLLNKNIDPDNGIKTSEN